MAHMLYNVSISKFQIRHFETARLTLLLIDNINFVDGSLKQIKGYQSQKNSDVARILASGWQFYFLLESPICIKVL